MLPKERSRPINTSPMTMAARPITIAPVPMPMSAYFWLWHTRAPDKPTRPLLMVSASSLVQFVFTPWARIIASLLPVARMALPISVPKNQYRKAIINTATPIPSKRDASCLLIPVQPIILEKIVSVFNNGTLLLPPMIRRLMDHSPICVRIPARIAGISNTVCKNPVTAPAAIPAAAAIIRAIQGSTPLFNTITAQTQPPRAKLPSTVKSAISKSL